MKKGQTKRVWTPEQKAEIVHKHLDERISVPKLLDEYVYYYNNERPAAALGYKSPVQYKTELGF